MKRLFLLLFTLSFISLHAIAQGFSEPCFPVTATKDNKSFGYMIDCKDAQMIRKYDATFKKNNYKIKPEVLQGILEQSLEKFDAELAKNVTFSTSDNQILIEVKKGDREKFFQFSCNMFSSTKKLDDYLQKVDRSQIDAGDE